MAVSVRKAAAQTAAFFLSKLMYFFVILVGVLIYMQFVKGMAIDAAMVLLMLSVLVLTLLLPPLVYS